jgi:hypothetical protein
VAGAADTAAEAAPPAASDTAPATTQN